MGKALKRLCFKAFSRFILQVCGAGGIFITAENKVVPGRVMVQMAMKMAMNYRSRLLMLEVVDAVICHAELFLDHGDALGKAVVFSDLCR